MAPYLYDLCQFCPESAGNCLREVIKEKQNPYRKLHRSYPSTDTVCFNIYLVFHKVLPNCCTHSNKGAESSKPIHSFGLPRSSINPIPLFLTIMHDCFLLKTKEKKKYFNLIYWTFLPLKFYTFSWVPPFFPLLLGFHHSIRPASLLVRKFLHLHHNNA